MKVLTATTQAGAREALEQLDAADHLDAVVAAPELPDGDGGAVLRAVRDRWPDAACVLHGDLWAIPRGSSLPVCEFHPPGQTPADVAAAVSEAVRGRYHRPYPVPADEDRRLEVLESIDFASRRSDLEGLAGDVEAETGADLAVVSVVDDHTVWVAAASEPPERCVLGRGDSASTYAIADDGVTVIDDVSSDERLAHLDRPYVDDLRSYAALPLSVDGAAVGALALLHAEPGRFSEASLEALTRYATATERVLATAR